MSDKPFHFPILKAKPKDGDRVTLVIHAYGMLEMRWKANPGEWGLVGNPKPFGFTFPELEDELE